MFARRIGPMLLIEAMAISIEVFLRSGFGCRYIGLQALLAAVVMPLYAMLIGPDAAPMMWFWLFFMCFALGEWLKALRRSWRGDVTHSWYSGRSRIITENRQCSEIDIKKWLEPCLVLCVGLCTRNAPACAYLCSAAVCLSITAHRTEGWIRRHVIDMNDAVLMQQDIAERFRRLQERR
jgi:hypothetical protein